MLPPRCKMTVDPVLKYQIMCNKHLNTVLQASFNQSCNQSCDNVYYIIVKTNQLVCISQDEREKDNDIK